MNSKKPKWKRLLSSLLMLAMLATLFPVSAFAITYQEATLSPHNFAVDEDGNFTTDLNLPDGFDEEVSVTREGNTFKGANWKLPETLTVNLWVDSKSMSDEENGTVPYVKDVMGRTWTLSKISITNKSTPTEGQTLIELLSISPETSKNDYVVDLSEISIDARPLGRYSYYDIYYLWELTKGDPTPTQYQVTYDLNLPSELSDSKKTLFPVYRVDDRENMDVLSEDGQLYVVEKAVEALSGSVYENVQFTVADFSNTLYVDFLVFDEDSYYDFDGWYIEGDENTLYQTGDVLTAGDSLAGGGDAISFKAKWTKIPPLVSEGQDADTVLAALEARAPILSSDTRNVADNVLITQWTDTDANLSGDRKSGETVMLDEDRTIYYQMSASVNSALYSSYFSPTTMPPEDFMTFTLSLDVDDKLEFVDGESDQATLTFNSPIFKVTETNIENANFSEYPDKNGDSTITFDPDNIPDGNVITVTVKWNENVENNHIAPSGTMTLSGFAFKLKDGAASKDMEISTSGNITGSLDLKKPNGINQRYYYQTVLNLLNSNFYGYQEAFDGDASDPTAYVHAMQFTDLVTSDYDLSQDANAVLDSNDAAATYTQYTITATAGENGSITPGTTQVYKGNDQTFTITANNGYRISDVLVDGKSVGAVDSHTFKNVDANHEIVVTFEKKSSPPYIPPVDDDDDQPEDPDDTGVSDLLNTKDHDQYLFGYPDGTFGPGLNMTRAEVAQMFYNLLVDQDVTAKPVFDDVPEDAWYAEPVNVMAKLDIVEGVGDDMFEPNREITRAEFTAMAMRFAEGETGGKNIFSDVDEDDWFYEVVVDSIKYGWIEGYPDGTFRPANLITREEVTTIVNRMLGRLPDEKFIDAHEDDLDLFPDVTNNWAYYDVVEATNDHQYKKTSSGEDWTKLG